MHVCTAAMFLNCVYRCRLYICCYSLVKPKDFHLYRDHQSIWVIFFGHSEEGFTQPKREGAEIVASRGGRDAQGGNPDRLVKRQEHVKIGLQTSHVSLF